MLSDLRMMMLLDQEKVPPNIFLLWIQDKFGFVTVDLVETEIKPIS